jgi:hypothetical protein
VPDHVEGRDLLAGGGAQRGEVTAELVEAQVAAGPVDRPRASGLSEIEMKPGAVPFSLLV